MTIVAAVRWHGVTYLGADSQTSSAATGHAYATTKRKWIIGNGCAIAAAGNCIVGDVLRRSASVILAGDPTIDEIVIRGRAAVTEWKPERELDFGMVAVNTAGVFVICQDWDYVAIRDGELAAVGSGQEYAIGAYHAAWNSWAGGQRPDPDVCLRLALEAACRYDTGCGGDIFIHSIRAQLGDADGIRSPDIVTYPCRQEGVAAIWDRDQRRRINGFGETGLAGESEVGTGPTGDAVGLPADCQG